MLSYTWFVFCLYFRYFSSFGCLSLFPYTCLKCFSFSQQGKGLIDINSNFGPLEEVQPKLFVFKTFNMSSNIRSCARWSKIIIIFNYISQLGRALINDNPSFGRLERIEPYFRPLERMQPKLLILWSSRTSYELALIDHALDDEIKWPTTSMRHEMRHVIDDEIMRSMTQSCNRFQIFLNREKIWLTLL